MYDAGSTALGSGPWRSQGHGMRQQPQGVARFVATLIAATSFVLFLLRHTVSEAI